MDKGTLFTAFVLLAAACLVVPLAGRLKLGSVLGYLLAGIALGPFVSGLVQPSGGMQHLAEFGVIMMLFLIGLELEPERLWRLRHNIVGLGGLQVVITAAAFTATGMAFGVGWPASLVIGIALALSSTALVLQMLQEKGLLSTTAGQSSFAVLLFQDIVIIPVLIALPLLAASGTAGTEAQGHGAGLLVHQPGWIKALAVLASVLLIVGGGKYASRFVFRYIAKTNLREVFTAFSLLLVLGTALLMQLVGISPALGAFLAGVVLANSEYKHAVENDIEPFKGLLLGLFFISIGIGMDFNLLHEKTLALLLTVLLLISIKMLVLYALARLFRMDITARIIFATALAQGGEFAFVLLQYGTGLELVPEEQTSLMIMAIAISMAATPLLMLLAEKTILPRFLSALPEPVENTGMPQDNPVIIAGYGRFGQIIGRFLKAQGIGRTILENDPDQIAMLRRFGNKVYFGDASRLDLLESAGAARAKILVVAVNDADKSLEIVRLARQHFPRLTIMARARNRRHAYELHKAGADVFRRETLDSSLWLAQQVMRHLGHRAYTIHLKANQFLRHDEQNLRTSFEFFEKEPELINFARQATDELERVLRRDVTTTPEKRPARWG